MVSKILPRISGVRRHANRRLAMAGGLVAATLLTIGVGAYATFTSTTSATPTIASGTVTLAAISPSAANNRLSVGATNIAAGDTIQRAVDVINTGTLALSTVTMNTSATASSLLDTDATNGLQVVIDKCSVAWTETGGPPYTYTCSGTTTSVLASAPVIGTNIALSNINVTASTDNFLRVTMTLPSTAGNTFQGLSSTLSFGFTATQRAAAAQ